MAKISKMIKSLRKQGRDTVKVLPRDISKDTLKDKLENTLRDKPEDKPKPKANLTAKSNNPNEAIKKDPELSDKTKT